MPLKYPDILNHNNPDLPLVRFDEMQGGAWNVADKPARNVIPIAKRNTGMIVSWVENSAITTMRYDAVSVSDVEWSNDANWSPFGGGGDGIGSNFSKVIFVDAINGSDEYVKRRGQTDLPYKTIIAARDRAGGYYVEGTVFQGDTTITGIDPSELANARIGDLICKREASTALYGSDAYAPDVNPEHFFSAIITDLDKVNGTITLSKPFDTVFIDPSGPLAEQDVKTFRVIPQEGLKKLIIVMPGEYTFNEDEKYMDYGNYDFGGSGLCRAGLDWFFHPGVNITIHSDNMTPLFAPEYIYSYMDINDNKITVSGGTSIYGKASFVNLSDTPIYKAVRNVGVKATHIINDIPDGSNREITQFNEEGNIFEFFKIYSICPTSDILIDMIPSMLEQGSYGLVGPQPGHTFPIDGQFGQTGQMNNDEIYYNMITIRGNYMYNSVGYCVSVYEATVNIDIQMLASSTMEAIHVDGAIGTINIGKIKCSTIDKVDARFYGYDLEVNCNSLKIGKLNRSILVRGIKEVVHNDEHKQGRVTLYGNSQNVVIESGIVNIMGTVNNLIVLSSIDNNFYPKIEPLDTILPYLNPIPYPTKIGYPYDAPDVRCESVKHNILIDGASIVAHIGSLGYKEEHYLDDDALLGDIYGPINMIYSDPNDQSISPYSFNHNGFSHSHIRNGATVFINHVNIQSKRFLIVQSNSSVHIDSAILGFYNKPIIDEYNMISYGLTRPITIMPTAEVFIQKLNINGDKVYGYTIPTTGGIRPEGLIVNSELYDRTQGHGLTHNTGYAYDAYNEEPIIIYNGGVLYLKDMANDTSVSGVYVNEGGEVILNASILVGDALIPPINGEVNSKVTVYQGGVSMNFVDAPYPGETFWANKATIGGVTQPAPIYQDINVKLITRTI